MADPEKVPGVYILAHAESGKLYFGSTSDLYLRSRQHEYTLRVGKHRNPQLQEAYEQTKEFVFIGFETPDRETAYDAEQLLFDRFGKTDWLFNSSLNARNPGEFTPEARIKIAEKLRGRSPSEETRAKIGDAHRGKTISPEAIEKMRNAHCSPKTALSGDGVEYSSVQEAVRVTGISNGAIRNRISSPTFPTWFRLNKEENK